MRAYLALAAVALAAVLLPPMHGLAHDSFAWHMVQHLVLIFGVAPLLTFALPHPTLPRYLVAPIVVVALHAIALWAWHLPALYDEALQSPPLHALEHISFVGTGVLFWGVVAARWRPLDQLRRAAVVFVTGLQSAALGALLVFATEPLYTAHLGTTGEHGLTPLEDQQLAGGLMWVPPGIVYLVLTLALLLSWMKHDPAIARQGGAR
jgi:putative membrane protein